MNHKILEYQGPLSPEEKLRRSWWYRHAVTIACSTAILSALASLFASALLWNALSATGVYHEQISALFLFVIGVPLLFFLLITSAITLGLVYGETTAVRMRGKGTWVLVPQAIAVLLPFAVVLLHLKK